MTYKIAKTNSLGAVLLRAALAGSLTLATLLATGVGVGAQTPSDIKSPTPYSWPTFHAGGTAGPNPFLYTTPATGTTSLDQPNPPSPIYSQLMGTPTGFTLLNATGNLQATSKITEVPSFLLGNYIPSQPPYQSPGDASTGILTYFPNNFRDDQFNIRSWSAPFTFLVPSATNPPANPGATGIVVDDDNTNNTITGDTVAYTGTWTHGLSDGTATNSAYSSAGAVAADSNTGLATAVYTFTVPASPGAGLYSVTLHLPSPVSGQYRIPDAHYTVTAATGATTRKLFDGRISQTETNDPQALAGPFSLAVGDVVKVTLDNSTNAALTNTPVVLTDSVTLIPGSIAGGSAIVSGSPTAINVTQYPEIQDALFYGFSVNSTTDPVTGVTTQNAFTPDNPTLATSIPFGNRTIGTAPAATDTAGLQHSIYQLVYFGRYESIVLTDTAGNLVDANGKATTTPVTQQVGAIYCVDGINGYVVWRFQTPDVLNIPIPATATAVQPVPNASQAVFSTPSIARVNVKVNTGTAASPVYTTLTKLVVTVADNNGMVYCLDAIGNRNGTSNTFALPAGTAANAYNQPIYNPGAGLNQIVTDGNGAAIAPHVGTTNAYWIYRPNLTKDLVSTKTRTIKPASDLPIPLGFGLASPTIYTDPTQPIDTTTIAPGVTVSTAATPPTLASNATVYIGNSNGTLYSLDALGQPVTVPATGAANVADGPDAGTTGDPFDTSHYIGILSARLDLSATPTPKPIWWFSVNTDPTADATATGNASITSTPAILQTTITGTTSVALSQSYQIFITTANDTANEGRVYSVLSTGPVGVATIGGTNYNTLSRPNWSFPNAYKNTGILKFRPTLGSIHGSPVIFTNPDDKTTRVYFAANANEDEVIPADQGRIWAVRALPVTAPDTPGVGTGSGTAVWAYPDTYDPNVYSPGVDTKKPAGAKTLNGQTLTASATVDDPPAPIGAFDYATPAVGIVQYPTTITYGVAPATPTTYVHTDAVNTGGINGVNVPMLYVGSHIEADDSSNFFALDLDGSNDVQRNIFVFGTAEANGTNFPVGDTPSGAGFQSSPLLVVNSSTTPTNVAAGPGNGGSVFITGADNNLYQLSATPISDVAPAGGTSTSTAPQFPLFALYSGFGPLSSPAVAAFSANNLGGTNIDPATGLVASAVDWVYGGDGKLGIARGITPGITTGSGAAGVDYGAGGPGPDTEAPGYVPQNFPLHAYILADGTTPDMSKAATVGSTLPVFEWGQSVFIRISNVVPPNGAVLGSDGSLTVPTGAQGSVNYFMHQSGVQPTDPASDIIYTNGGPITIQLTDVDAQGNTAANAETDSVTIPATVIPDTLTTPKGNGLNTTPPGNGFVHEILSGSGAQDNQGDLLVDTTNNAWLGAATYAIGDGSNRRNTPGARRRIVSATQIAQAYRRDANGVYAFVSSVTLQVTVNSSANAVTRVDRSRPPVRSLERIAPVDQPTFGILNPIAVRAAGYPLQLGAAPNYAIPILGSGQLGPFNGFDGTAATTQDLEAYANGNRVPTTVPTGGVVTGGRGRRGQSGQRFVPIITSTNDINHGTTGDNADPTNLNSPPPVSNSGLSISTTETTGTTAPPFNFGQYTLNVADRSALGLISSQIRNLTIETADAQWHDNTGTNGPGATVNPMPWDAPPIAFPGQANSSVDYPNIPGNAIAHNLQTNQRYTALGGTTPGTPGNISNQPGAPDPVTPDTGGDVIKRNVYVDPVQVQIKVPQFQPANLQLFDQTQGEITPNGIQPTTSVVFPQGYVTRENIFVDSNHNHRFDAGEAYRQIRVFTGVPVDLSTAIQNTTVDLGRLPQSFGLQTDNYGQLGLFQPYLVNPTSVYPQFFKPLTIVNKGNVNLVNLHLDQKLSGVPVSPSVFLGDTLDSLAFIPATDDPQYTSPRYTLPITGLRSASLPNTSVPEQPYLLRSSLDPDLVTAYGRNPSLTGNTTYPGATAHKARVGDAAPAVVTVPDVSHDNDDTQAGTGANLARAGVTPTISGTGVLTNLNPATNQPYPVYAPPTIGLAVPLGTPVGNYSLVLQAFEGLDPANYANVYNNPSYGATNAPYAAILPPRYGSAEINSATPPDTTGLATPANLNDSITLVANGSGRPVPLQPYSNGTTVKATVTEARITNGASRGDLPQVDSAPSGNATSGTASSANFLPSAFRDPATGNVSLYWTSSASRPLTTGSPYYLVGANLGFNPLNATDGYFSAANTGGNWWKAIDLTAAAPPANSLNSGISVFTGNGTAYALVQNVAGGGTIPLTNNLLCYPVTPGSGALVGPGVPVSQNTSQSTFGARGLLTGTFTDPTGPNPQTINNNLWAFWYGGARGRSAVYYNSSTGNGGAPGAFGTPAVLPIPAGLVSVADPTAIETSAPDPANNANSIPVIEVTYTGTDATGNADIYVSRYRPYFVQDAQGKSTSQVALALLASPVITEQLIGTDGNLYYQARDVAWARNGALSVSVNNLTTNILAGITPTYDRATGLLVYTGTTVGTVYVDLARGRVRFSPQLKLNAIVTATFNAQARRITTDTRADTAPISFIDDALKPNEANSAGTNFGSVEADRYWYIWRKSGAPGTSTTPTLYYKTQRLTIDVVDVATNKPVSFKLDSTGKPAITVTVGGTTVYTPTSTTSPIDIDYVRGHLYFPILIGTQPSEGQSVHVTGTTSSGGTIDVTDTVHWLDEPRYNDPASLHAQTSPPAIAPNSTGDAAIPIDTIVNESNVTAFLDPKQPHKVWLFWNSTRNGTADIYYETISPLFSAKVGG